MKKEHIVEKFLEQGLLLSPRILDNIEENNIENVFSLAKKSENFIITEIDKPEIDFKIEKNENKEKLRPKDFIEYNKEKYDFLKNIISKKIKPISIDKISSFKEISVICFVLEKTNNGYLVEDSTGKIEIKTEAKILINSVLGFTGKIRENFLFVEKIIYPDIPLENKVKKCDLKIQFSKKPKKTENLTITQSNEKTENTLNLPNPGRVKINKINILAYEPEKKLTKEEAVNFLKYRFIPGNQPLKTFLIKTIPDIFWINQKQSWIENYKGITILSSDGLLDLKTRKLY